MENSLFLNINPKMNVAIHKDAFFDIVKTLPSHINDIQVINNKINIDFVQNYKNVVFYLDVKVKKEAVLSIKLEEIRSKIETHTKLLINKKPFNIIINFIGVY